MQSSTTYVPTSKEVLVICPDCHVQVNGITCQWSTPNALSSCLVS